MSAVVAATSVEKFRSRNPPLCSEENQKTEQLLRNFFRLKDEMCLQQYLQKSGRVNVHVTQSGRVHDGAFTIPLLARVCSIANTSATQMMVNNSSCEIDIKDHWGYTPLMYAIKSLNLQNATILLKSNANPDIATSKGETAVSFAIQTRSDAILELLLRYGASPNVKIHTSAVSRRLSYSTHRWISPLVLSIKTQPSAFKTIRSLLQAGALPEVIDRDTVCDIVRRCVGCWKEALGLLIQSGFKFEPHRIDPDKLDQHVTLIEKEVNDYLEAQASTPLYLQNFCKIRIRATIILSSQNRDIVKSVNELPLPKLLNEYLKTISFD